MEKKEPKPSVKMEEGDLQPPLQMEEGDLQPTIGQPRVPNEGPDDSDLGPPVSGPSPTPVFGSLFTPHEPKPKPNFDPELARGWEKLSGTVDRVNQNIANYNKANGTINPDGSVTAKPASDIWEAIEAGFQYSLPGMMGRNRLPDLTADNLPGLKGWVLGAASHMTTMLAEFPEMASAAFAAGSAIAPAAAGAGPYAPFVVAGTSGYAAFAGPAFLRREYAEHLQKGNVKNFQDFWERLSAGILEAHNEGMMGAAMGLGGSGAAAVMSPIEKSLIQKGWTTAAASGLTKAAVMTSELTSMAGMGMAINQRMPDPASIAEAVLAMGVFHAGHALTHPTGKALTENFVRTGLKPSETVEASSKDPVLSTELHSVNPDPKKIAELSTGIKQPPEPRDTWYHGTASRIENFDESKLGSNTEVPSAKKGFFFVNDPKVAAQYAEYAKSDSVRQSEESVKAATEFGDRYGIHNDNYLKPEKGETFSHALPLTEENLIKKNPGLEPEEAKEVLEKYKELSKDANTKLSNAYKDGEDQAIYATHLNLKNPMIVDFKGETYRDKSYSDLIDEAKEKGHDGVIFQNTHDAPFKSEEEIPPHHVAVAFNKDQIEFKYSGPSKEPPPPPPEKPDVEKALQAVAGTIGKKEKTAPEGADKHTWYQRLFSQFDPVKRLQDWLDPESKIPENERPFDLATLTKGVKGKMSHFLKQGTLDFKTGKKNGDGLFQIIEPLQETNEIGKLSLYMKARRAFLDLEPRGIKTSIPEGQAQIVYEALKDRFEPYAEKITQWSNRVSQYAMDAGLIPDNWLDQVGKLNQHYIKYSAIFTDDEGNPTGKTATPGSFKKIKGGDYLTEDPLLAISQNMMAIVKASEINRAKLSALEMVEKDPNQTIFKTVSQARPVELKPNELRDIIEEQFGVDVGDEAKKATIWRRKAQTDLLPNQFDVMRNGVRQVIEVADTPLTEPTTPLPFNLDKAFGREATRESVIRGEDFANAMKSLNSDPLQQNFLVNAMRGVTKAVKFGATFTGEFLTFHALNNKILASVQSEFGSPTTSALVGAMKSIWSENEAFWDFISKGGGGTYFDLNENYLAKNLTHLQEQTGNHIWDRMYNLIPNTVHAIENVGSMLEQSYRMVEYQNKKAKLLAQGASEEAASTGAAMSARALTIDYDRRGLMTSGYNSISAFTTMRLQHMDRVYQGLKDPQTRSQMIIQGLKWITFPSLALKIGQLGNKRVEQATREEKDLNWILDIPWFTKAGPDDKPGLLPPEQKEMREDGLYINRGFTLKSRAKGGLMTLFKVIPERMVEAMADFAGHPQAGSDDILKSFMTAVGEIIPGMPDAPKPILEQALNKNFFTGHPVVTNASQRVLPAEQYTNYTSATARALGKLIGSVPPMKSIAGGPSIGDIGTKEAKISSPEVIDNYIHDYSSGLGKYITFALDQALYKAGVVPDTRPSMKLNDIPFIRAFLMRYPQANSASIEEFRTKQEEADKLQASVKLEMHRFQPDAAKALMQNNERLMFSAKGIEKGLHEDEQQIQKIYSMPNYDPKTGHGFSPEDKGKLIDSLYYQMITKAKAGNEMLDKMRDAVDKAQQKKRTP